MSWAVVIVIDEEGLDSVFGPFATQEGAAQWADNFPDVGGEYCHVLELHAPDPEDL